MSFKKQYFLFLASAILLTIMLGAGVSARAAANDLFFSEYIEGSSFNKAVEIYNGTGTAVDLSTYTLELYSNGAASPSQSVALSGSLADRDVFVIAHGSADMAILAVADVTSSNVINFNGNDALVLRNNGGVVDSFGQVGVDPGSEWTGGGQDDTLRRAESVCAGDTSPDDPFDVSAEWVTFAQNTFDGLGDHTANCGDVSPTEPEILLTEIVVTPTGGEFIEIHNPAGSTIDLSNYYLTDATFAGGSTFYYNIVTGSNAGGGGFSDFLARFPDGASIDAGEYQTIAMSGSAAFLTEFSIAPDYELFDDSSADGEQLMREAFPGSINGQGGLSNDGEVVVLFTWDGQSDLVTDVDYALWGDKAEAVDKTGVTIDGPDTDSDTSSYLPDTAVASQDVIATGSHAFGNSWQRDDLTEGAETTSGGNGVNGEDETSENLSVTWCESAPTPGAATICASPSEAELIITEIMYNPSSAEDDWEWVEIYNAGMATIDLTGYVIDDINTVAHTSANIAGGSIAARESAVLFNVDDVSESDYTSAWGTVNLIPVTNWNALALNNSGDTIGLWSSFASYSGDNTTHANTIESVAYDDSGPWPTDDGFASIYLTNLAADNNDGANWALSAVDVATPLFEGYQSAAAGGNSGNDVGSPGTPTPGGGLEFGDCFDDSETQIHTIQGSGLASMLEGEVVNVEGVVVATFQGANQIGGYHLQEEDADADADPLTSEGLYIFDNTNSPAVGDIVRIQGTVSEFNGLTELSSITNFANCSSGGVATPATVNLPVTSIDEFEKYEGMAVTIPQPLYISEYFNFDRFGEIVLTTDRQFQPTATFEPGSPEAADLALANSLSRITLDDGRGNQNPDPAIHPNGLEFTLDNLFRGGDTVENVTGVMDYAFGLYRIQPTQGADYTIAIPRPVQPNDVGGSLKVASFNVLNYFTTLDDSGPICGPQEDQDCRGADDANEFTRQRDKIIAALVEIDADVVGLIEIENHPDDVPTADLVSGLNNVMGAGTYDYIATGAIGSDAIRVAFIYKPASVSPVGSFAVLDSSVDPRFLDDFNRPVLAQTFQENATGEIVTVAVNHLKSKGSPCDVVGDPDTGDGSGNCNLTRKAAAEALVDWLATDPTGSGDADFLIIGDLNSYDKEDPIDVILQGADDTLGTGDDYSDLLLQLIGENAYSYVFDGQLGYLDHALANQALLSEVTGTTVWHINADEPDLIDYDTSFKQDAQDAIYAPDAYRSSDHDPVIVGLNLADLGSIKAQAFLLKAKLAYDNINGETFHELVRIDRDGIIDGAKLDISARDGRVRSSFILGFGVKDGFRDRWLVNGDDILSFRKDDSADGVFTAVSASFYVGFKKSQTITVEALLNGKVVDTQEVLIESHHAITKSIELPINSDFDELVFSATGNGAFGVRNLNLTFENDQITN